MTSYKDCFIPGVSCIGQLEEFDDTFLMLGAFASRKYILQAMLR